MSNPEKLLVAVAGPPGSGKTKLVSGLVNECGFEARNIGDELARLYRVKHGLPEDYPVTGLERMPMHKEVRATNPGYFLRFCIDGDYSRRAVDGLRNLHDARGIVGVGGYIVSLIAPLPLRIKRREEDRLKDPDLDGMIIRELSESDDPDVDGAQATAVMGLARQHGFYIDSSQSPEKILEDTRTGFFELGIEL